jgi:hypothetical protein
MSLGDEFAARLTQLAELHADGALTDEELIAAKARLLKSGGRLKCSRSSRITRGSTLELRLQT